MPTSARSKRPMAIEPSESHFSNAGPCPTTLPFRSITCVLAIEMPNPE